MIVLVDSFMLSVAIEAPASRNCSKVRDSWSICDRTCTCKRFIVWLKIVSPAVLLLQQGVPLLDYLSTQRLGSY